MSLTNKTLGGFFWAFLERFGVMGLQMVIFIILARILAPEAFGLIGMLAVFIAISQSLTDSGFGQALIQKKDADEVDYSSVFYVNLILGVGIYVILFFCAPWISSFYSQPLLTGLIRVLSIKFVISAFSLVQVAKLTKEVRFKNLMIAKLPSTIIGGALGVGAAYSGFGVWSLVIQQLADSTSYSIQIWIQSKWRPQFVCKFKRIKTLFDFGGRLMISGILHKVYLNIYEVVIGYYYTAAQVGFYMQANKIKSLPVQSISSTLNRVTFPILSEIQDDDERLRSAYRKIMRQVLLFIAPVMVGAIVVAEPLFRFVLTEKWLPAVPYFQWLCITGLFYPINAYNLNILKVKGRSDLYLRLEIIKKVIGVTGILIAVHYSVLALVMFNAFLSVIEYGINSYYSGRFIQYGIRKQIVDLRFIAGSAFIMGIILYGFNTIFNLDDFLLLSINFLLGICLYLAFITIVDKQIILDTKKMLSNIR